MSWKNQLNLLIYLLGKISKSQENDSQPVPIMSRDEAYAVWDEIDNYRYGHISSSSLQRWLNDFAEFNLPFEDLHYLYDCFEVRESEGRVSEQQFLEILCGPPESENNEEDANNQSAAN